jgi:hypothetical protein
MSIHYTPKNLCGRRINYPHFGKPDEFHQRMLQNDIPPPGVEVLPSPCGSYYKTKDPSKMDEECQDCVYQSYDVDRNCPCVLDTNMNKQNICKFAKCVRDHYENQSNPQCVIPYNALFNVGDVRDDAYIPQFSFRDMNC